MSHDWSVYTRLADLGNMVEIVFYYHNQKDEFVVLTPEGVQVRPPGSHLEYLDSIFLKRKNAQALMDALWQCGLRPSEGSGSAGAMLAAQEHIKDLREVYKKLFEIVSK